MGIYIFASFGASQRVGASEELLSLGTGGKSLLIPNALFDLEGQGDWPPPGVGRFVSEL